MQTIDISFIWMGAFYLLLIIPVVILYYLNTGLTRTIFIAALRMTLQLGFVAVYLEVIFSLNSIWLNLLWILVMMVAANVNILTGSGLKVKRFFMPVFAGLLMGGSLIIGFFVFLAIRPEPVYDARYLIPISGMILGNCLRANVISLERFYSGLRKNEKEYLTYLLMGASLHEATRPFVQESVKPALAPTLSTMATVGLVSLPGMMTGQILGGSDPTVAIKYQVAIMISIFTATVLTAILNLYMSMRTAFTEYQMLDTGIFSG